MRKLTVIRRKSFVASLCKVKIYIEDAEGDTKINGVNCKLLGKIKNNERATFEIGNESLKLFAIYDKASKGFCNDCYIIPEGEDEHFVSGIATYNPFKGNPFYFDGVDDEAIARRKKNGKIALMIFIPLFAVAIAVGVLIGLLVV